MNRTQFLQTILPIGLGAFFMKDALAFNEPNARPNWPNTPGFLKPGDTIAITCPGGPLENKDLQNCISTLQSWGFKTKVGKTIGHQWQRYGGTDKERAEDFQACLDDPAISAILFGRGGYGVMRIIDTINWEKFVANPKWLIGFSDITAIHCHVNASFGIPTMHAHMANGFTNHGGEASESIRLALTGKTINYNFAGTMENICGQISGELVGGNLSLIYAMQASKSELKTTGRILLIEDVSEFKYSVDRMLMNLKRSGKLEGLAALVVGGLSIKDEADPDYVMHIEELVYEKVKEYNYPVCFKFPAGHQRNNFALKLGIPYQLTVGKSFCNLTELPNKQFKPAVNQTATDSLQASDVKTADETTAGQGLK
ncbi:MAG: LD-carboxypeptidase [Bacteroidota bacterium]